MQKMSLLILIGVIVMSGSNQPVLGDEQASNKPDALLMEVEQLKEAGQFKEAEELLKNQITAIGDPQKARPYVDALEIIRRIKLDYSLKPSDLYKKMVGDIPDLTSQDLERWRLAGVLQYRTIDGNVRYFKREPVNLYRFCEEAKQRREANKEWNIRNHVAEVVKIAETSDSPEVYPVRHKVTYKLKVNDKHPLKKKGNVVRCWLPVPQEYRQQKDLDIMDLTKTSTTPMLAPNGHPQRTMCFTEIIEDPEKPLEFMISYEFTTYAFCPKLDPAKVQPYDTSSELYKTNTAERLPHILFSPDLKAKVAEIVGNETNPLLKAKKIYMWICNNIKYCAEVEYGTIPSISDKAFRAGKGDCGVFGMLYITMCRIAGVPARWQSGWELKPSGWNMHDWTEFYVEPWGWLPADPSYGLMDHPDPRIHEFNFGHMDSYRMIVNLDYARELTPSKRSLRSEPNDFQRGEVEINELNLYFNEWDWDFTVESEPLTKKNKRKKK